MRSLVCCDTSRSLLLLWLNKSRLIYISLVYLPSIPARKCDTVFLLDIVSVCVVDLRVKRLCLTRIAFGVFYWRSWFRRLGMIPFTSPVFYPSVMALNGAFISAVTAWHVNFVPLNYFHPVTLQRSHLRDVFPWTLAFTSYQNFQVM